MPDRPRSHFRGVAVGDTSIGIFGSAILSQRVALTETDVPVQLHFADPSLLTQCIAVNQNGVQVAVDLTLSSGGNTVFAGSTRTAGLTDIGRVAKGYVEAQVSTAINPGESVLLYVFYTGTV
jgi:hypothetical protein